MVVFSSMRGRWQMDHGWYDGRSIGRERGLIENEAPGSCV